MKRLVLIFLAGAVCQLATYAQSDSTEVSYRLSGFMTDAQAFVVATDLFPDEQISRVEYNEFLCRIPDDRKSEFDMNHIMISPLSKDELRHIFKE